MTTLGVWKWLKKKVEVIHLLQSQDKHLFLFKASVKRLVVIISCHDY